MDASYERLTEIVGQFVREAMREVVEPVPADKAEGDSKVPVSLN